MGNLKHVRQQGRDAKKHNDDNTDKDGNVIDTGVRNFTAHDCPYGPGDNRDAWMAGFGGQGEDVEQVDTSTATTQDVRPKGDTTKVKEGAKPKKAGKGKAGEGAADATKVVTDVTGTGETSLQTKVEQRDPQAADTTGGAAETIIGDPAGSKAPDGSGGVVPGNAEVDPQGLM